MVTNAGKSFNFIFGKQGANTQNCLLCSENISLFPALFATQQYCLLPPAISTITKPLPRQILFGKCLGCRDSERISNTQAVSLTGKPRLLQVDLCHLQYNSWSFTSVGGIVNTHPGFTHTHTETIPCSFGSITATRSFMPKRYQFGMHFLRRVKNGVANNSRSRVESIPNCKFLNVSGFESDATGSNADFVNSVFKKMYPYLIE